MKNIYILLVLLICASSCKTVCLPTSEANLNKHYKEAQKRKIQHGRELTKKRQEMARKHQPTRWETVVAMFN